jgi:hypothetical protein
VRQIAAKYGAAPWHDARHFISEGILVPRQLRQALTVLAAAAVTVVLPIAVASPAAADRCQPEELVIGSGNSPYEEEDSPFCDVMLGTVYPTLGCNDTLLGCVNYLTADVFTGASNPIPPTGPLPDEAAYVIYCTFDTIGGDSVYCISPAD